jgi:hypothetical protein
MQASRSAARSAGASGARRPFAPARASVRVAALKQLPDFALETDASTAAQKVTLSSAVRRP